MFIDRLEVHNNTMVKNTTYLAHTYCIIYCHVKMYQCTNLYKTRCTRGVRVGFSVARMRSSNRACMNKLDLTTEKIGSVHMTVFEIVAHRNVDNWTQILK